MANASVPRDLWFLTHFSWPLFAYPTFLQLSQPTVRQNELLITAFLNLADCFAR